MLQTIERATASDDGTGLARLAEIVGSDRAHPEAPSQRRIGIRGREPRTTIPGCCDRASGDDGSAAPPTRAELVVRRLMAGAHSAHVAANWQQALAYADTALRLVSSDPGAMAVRQRARLELTGLALQGRLPAGRPDRLGTAVPDATGNADAVRADRLSALRAAALAIPELQPSGTIAEHVIRLAQDDRTPEAHLVRAVAADPTLTTTVLRAANAEPHGHKGRVRTVREAVHALGPQAFRATVAKAGRAERRREPAVVSVDDYWRFALVVGTLADLCARVEGVGRGRAFTAGIIHNIGLLALDAVDPEGLQAAINRRDVGGLQRLADRQRAMIGFSAAELGAELARAWHFPAELVHVIERSEARREEAIHADSISRYVVSARIMARSQGLHDGAEQTPRRRPPIEWQIGALAENLERVGGFDHIVRRVSAVLEATSVAVV